MAGASHQAKFRPSTPPPSHRNAHIPTTPNKASVSPGQSSPASKGSASYPQQQRRSFVHHLTRWAGNHDASPYFHGKIVPVAQTESVQAIGLGKSVRCVLTDTAWTNAKKHIVIRLFAPGDRDSRYRMVVRCGSGWISARDFLSKEYFKSKRLCATNKKYSIHPGALLPGLEPTERDSVTIQPLFLPFLRLPLELQQSVLAFAAGLGGRYHPNRHSSGRLLRRSFMSSEALGSLDSPISLGTVMRISKAMNTHLVPWVFRTTDFQFETTGFTSFLWLCGPQRRAEIKHITFRFSEVALLHCLRWFAPDPIFELFEPPVLTTPPALCFLWRCQLIDLAKEVHIAVLTIDICGVPLSDLPMMVRILRRAFGSVEQIRFKHASIVANPGHKHLTEVITEKRSWREECRGWFEKQKNAPGLYSWPGLSNEKRRLSANGLEREMDRNHGFFDQVDCAWESPCF